MKKNFIIRNVPKFLPEISKYFISYKRSPFLTSPKNIFNQINGKDSENPTAIHPYVHIFRSRKSRGIRIIRNSLNERNFLIQIGFPIPMRNREEFLLNFEYFMGFISSFLCCLLYFIYFSPYFFHFVEQTKNFCTCSNFVYEKYIESLFINGNT